jgi:hydroxyquinol 1,2-dioxygenase
VKDRYLEPEKIDRRAFAASSIAAAVFTLLPRDASAACPATSRAVEGPYWRANAPLTTDIHRGDGIPLIVRGVVTDVACRPMSNVLIDVWQADEHGKYDVDYGHGQTFLRARIRTAEDGKYEFRTIQPAPYGVGGFMRPAHIHFALSVDGKRRLVTQLYFAGDPRLDRDPLRSVHPDLIGTPVRRGAQDEVQFDLRLA